jgi:hypothetical protein
MCMFVTKDCSKLAINYYCYVCIRMRIYGTPGQHFWYLKGYRHHSL